jgi:sucrose-6-phosphate hydrolase SacC (GH32 family)
LRILLDRGSVEVFANGGRIAMSVAAIAKERDLSLEILARGDSAKIVTLEVSEMKSIWAAK